MCLFSAKATTYNVTISNLQATINTSAAGDIIILANGTYTNASFIIGTASSTISGITVIAASNGGVIFTGTSTCSITGNNNTLSGFQYKNGDIGALADIVGINGNNNTITQCNFFTCRAHNYLHVNSGSQYSQITYCNFEAKAPNHNDGPAIQVTISPTVTSYTQIRYCTFMNDLGLGGDFGNEGIRIGEGSQQTYNSSTIVEYCYFENTGLGDSESISMKSMWNVLRYNTQNNNPYASFSFRTGGNNTAYSNFFINSGGIKVKENQNQMIYNNYFQGTSNGYNSSIELRSDGVVQPNTIYIYHNTFYNAGDIYLNIGNGVNTPLNVAFVNNIFNKTTGKIIADANPNVSFTNNEYFGGASLGVSGATTTQFTYIDPQLVLNSNNYYGLSASSPAIHNSNGTYTSIVNNPNVTGDPNILLDIKGLVRPADKTQKDMGCDQFTTGIITNKPISRYDVGPAYLNTTLPVTFVSITAINENTTNKIIWQTANEINNKGFFVQQSNDGNAFQNIGFVSAKGVASNYQFIDVQPFSKTYYRLLQVDFDGKQSYSKTVEVTTVKQDIVTLYPNPVTNQLFISGNGNTQYQLLIKDILGKTVISLTDVSAKQPISLAHLNKGIYIIQLTNSTTNIILTQKIIKN